jgi:hypothetical protein
MRHTATNERQINIKTKTILKIYSGNGNTSESARLTGYSIGTKADKIAQLQASQQDSLFLNDLQTTNDDFAHVDDTINDLAFTDIVDAASYGKQLRTDSWQR